MLLDLPSFKDLILSFCEPNTKEKNKYICPVCGGNNLSLHICKASKTPSGTWNCFSDESASHRQEICRWLNSAYWETQSHMAVGGKPVLRDRRWDNERYQVVLRVRVLETRLDELNYFLWNSIDEDYGLNEQVYWKEFIEFLIEGEFEPLPAINAAEEFTMIDCPLILKESLKNAKP